MHIILNEGRPSGKKSFPLFGILYLIYYIYHPPSTNLYQSKYEKNTPATSSVSKPSINV